MKLSLKKIVEAGLASWGGPGRPQGPNKGNDHHFHKHPQSKKYGRMYTWGTDKYPYVGDKDDLETGSEMTDLDKVESEVEGLPEVKLKELFKFTQSANDNTSFHRPPTMGSGPMAAYGKSRKVYGNYDFKDDEDNEKRLQDLDDRMKSSAQDIAEVIGPGLRYRHTDRGAWNMNTKQPWTQGIPGHGPEEDEIEGEKELEQLFDEPEESNNKSYEKLVKNEGSRYADTNFSKIAFQRVIHGPKADIYFWDEIQKDPKYLMNGDYEIYRRNKEVKRAKKKKKKL